MKLENAVKQITKIDARFVVWSFANGTVEKHTVESAKDLLSFSEYEDRFISDIWENYETELSTAARLGFEFTGCDIGVYELMDHEASNIEYDVEETSKKLIELIRASVDPVITTFFNCDDAAIEECITNYLWLNAVDANEGVFDSIPDASTELINAMINYYQSEWEHGPLDDFEV